MDDPPPDSDAASSFRAWRRGPVSMLFATVGGIGHLPGGPGTYAAAAFTPVVVAMSSWPLAYKIGLLAVVSLLSCYWCDVAERLLEDPDSRRIVIDEVVGVWVTLVWFTEPHLITAVVGLVAFRIFDIVKPPPVERFELDGGVGVILDDVVAGLWAIPFVLICSWLIGG